MSLVALLLVGSIAASTPSIEPIVEYLVEHGNKKISSCEQMGTTYGLTVSNVAFGNQEYDKLVFEYKVLNGQEILAARGFTNSGTSIVVVYDQKTNENPFDAVADGAWHKSLSFLEAIPYAARYLTNPCKLAKEVEIELVVPGVQDQEFFDQSVEFFRGEFLE